MSGDGPAARQLLLEWWELRRSDTSALKPRLPVGFRGCHLRLTASRRTRTTSGDGWSLLFEIERQSAYPESQIGTFGTAGGRKLVAAGILDFAMRRPWTPGRG